MYERRNYLHMAYHESGEGGASPRESINLDGISSESQVSLRELRESDIDSIARIVQKTWFSAMDSPVPVSPDGEEKDGRAPVPDQAQNESQVRRKFYAAKYDFLWYLNRCTHSVVAEADGKPLGIVLADIYSSHESGVQALKGQDTIFADYDTWIRTAVPDGNKYAEAIRQDDARTHELSDPVKPHTEAEIVLFIVDGSMRGQGLGKALWLSMLETLDWHRVRRYFLYTDTECNYMFYEYRGLLRVAEKINAKGPMGEPLDKFIYLGSPTESLSDDGQRQ